MSADAHTPALAFDGDRLIASGPLAQVAIAAWRAGGSPLVLDAETARAVSMAARARCPNTWVLEGLPACSRRYGSIASTTSAGSGVVAL